MNLIKVDKLIIASEHITTPFASLVLQDTYKATLGEIQRSAHNEMNNPPVPSICDDPFKSYTLVIARMTQKAVTAMVQRLMARGILHSIDYHIDIEIEDLVIGSDSYNEIEKGLSEHALAAGSGDQHYIMNSIVKEGKGDATIQWKREGEVLYSERGVQTLADSIPDSTYRTG